MTRSQRILALFGAVTAGVVTLSVGLYYGWANGAAFAAAVAVAVAVHFGLSTWLHRRNRMEPEELYRIVEETRTVTRGQKAAALIVYTAVLYVTVRYGAHVGWNYWAAMVLGVVIGLVVQTSLIKWFMHCNEAAEEEERV